MRVASYRLPRFTSLAAIFVIALVLITGAAPTLVGVLSGKKSLDDFHVVYSGARAMLDHAEIDAATNRMYIYSPFIAFVFQPLALLPERGSAIAWLILTAIIILAATIIASRKIAATWHLLPPDADRSMPWLVSAGALLLSFEKIRSDFILGQIDCLILLGLALIFCWMDGRPRFAAIAVGATANFKYLALIFVPYFLIKRNYRAAIASIGWFAFFFTLPALEVGSRLIGHYAMNAVAALAKVIGRRNFVQVALGGGAPVVNSVAWTNSVSLSSTVFRVTRSLQIHDAVAAIVIALLFTAIVAGLVWIGRYYDVDLLRYGAAKHKGARAQTNSIEWAALIVLALSFGPQTTARHMIMLMLVCVVGITLVLVEQRRSPRILLIASMIATARALSLPFRQTGIHPALIALKSAGIASWCAVLLIFSIAVIGCRKIFESVRSFPTS